MKKLLSIFLIAILAAGMAMPTAAEGEDYTYTALVNGKASAEVGIGGRFSVELVVAKNSGERFDLYSMQDYLVYDPEYVELNLESLEILKSGGEDVFAAAPISYGGNPQDRLYIYHSSTTAIRMDAEFTALRLEATAKKLGETTITHKTPEMTGIDLTAFSVATADASISITEDGDKQPPDKPDVNPPTSSTGGATTYFSITANAGEGGKIAPDGTTRVRRGSNAKFTVTPDEGYKIADVLVDGKSVGAVNEYTFERVYTSGKISATFEKIEDVPTTPTVPKEWENPFVDVNENDWFYENVKYVHQNKLMVGTTANAFSPDTEISRAMFVTVLYRMEGEPETALSKFTDLESGSWYEKAVAWSAANDIISGVSETEFAPNDNITREQMAAIAYRYAKFKGYDVTVSESISYTDSADISDYAKTAIAWAAEKGIMYGNPDGSFSPRASSTRAQAAAVFQRIIESLK